uniref:Sec1 family domain-containing protein 1 n=1 Tax=Romanomermis culicivorax TaxID=13658 RepID=A0A915JEP6_ROMCU
MQNVEASTSSSSLRCRQIARLKQMINFNQPISNVLTAEPVWKVLVLDKTGQTIFSPLLTVKELRELGVTLHLCLQSEREALSDVPAIYFVMPNENNIGIISHDLANGTYENYYFNFIGSIPRPKLEELASSAVKFDCLPQVQKVRVRINRPDMTEDSMNQTIDSIVDGLFSVFVTLGTVPIIRSPRGNAAELVAEKLDKKIRDNLRDARNNLFTGDNARIGQLSFQRPVLLIFDRSMDIATPLHHTWTYQALVHDVLLTITQYLLLLAHLLQNFDLNRVIIGAESSRKPKEYDLTVNDKIWMSQKGSPFPVVAEAVQEELEAYRASEDEIVRLKHAMGLDNESDEAISLLNDTNAKLTSAVSSLPELLEKKRLIDLHMNVATEVLEVIKTRKLDAYFETEEKLMNKQMPERSLIDIINDDKCGSLDDKLRLLAIHYICGEMSDNEFISCKTILESMECDTSALKYIKRWKSFAKTPMPQDQYTGGGIKTINMFSKLLTTSSQFVMEGVKNLVIKKHNLPLTKIVDAIMEMKSLPEIEDYRYFDPKLLRPVNDGMPRNRSPSNEAVIFVIGGGTYVEYQNLSDYIKSKPSGGQVLAKKITYGCTELINASQFLQQLNLLGKEI